MRISLIIYYIYIIIMDVLLIYSNKCKNSQTLFRYDVFNKIRKLNIDNPQERKELPHFVNSVPTLLIKSNNNLTIYKNNELLNWFIANSNKQQQHSQQHSQQHNQNTQQLKPQNNSKKNEDLDDILACNTLVNNNFSSNYTFIEDNSAPLLENQFAKLEGVENDIKLQEPNSNPNKQKNNTSFRPIDTRKTNSIDSDFEALMKSRNDEFQSINRT